MIYDKDRKLYTDPVSGVEIQTPITSAVKAIRAHCMDCSSEQSTEVRECTMNGRDASLCALYPFRRGRSPFTIRQPSGRQKAALSDGRGTGQ